MTIRIRALKFLEGQPVPSPEILDLVTVSALLHYPSDSAFETSNPKPDFKGSLYYRTSDDTVRLHNDSGWFTVRSDANELVIMDPAQLVEVHTGVQPSLDLNFTSLDGLPAGLSFERNSIGTYFDANGILQVASVDEPRIDHDPETGEALGILIEEQRTNLFLRSDDFGDSYWSKSNISVTSNDTVSPDGTSNADRLVAPTDSFGYVTRTMSFTEGVTYTVSCFVKLDNFESFYIRIFGETNIINLVTGLGVSGAFIDSLKTDFLPNGWFRFSITAISPSTASSAIQFGIFPGVSTGDAVFIYGAQLEAGAFATSYIPTEGSTVERVLDVPILVNGWEQGWFNSKQGGIFAEAKTFDLDFIVRSKRLLTGAPSQGIGLTLSWSPNGQARHFISGGNSAAQFAGKNGVGAGSFSKLVACYSATGYSLSVDGLTTEIIASNENPAGTTGNIRIGAAINNTDILNGHIKRLIYWPKQLPNDVLQLVSK